ncbi:4709_t:CDS:2 [Cetraspora pellucida]|uniref:4709_t:CDS:1 n=1 Tax=Cetraspora pellucida TaxID=1433469 RepID=A0A9N8ZF91_9GLOM|nr:4709_t:CDS:2 [Cetraspora pellucida]
MPIISRKLWKASVFEDFGAPTTSTVPQREFEYFHPNLGVPDHRPNINLNRGITGLNPGPSGGFNVILLATIIRKNPIGVISKFEICIQNNKPPTASEPNWISIY